MENPEYTERQINAALSERTSLDISVRWDGEYPDPEDDAVFDVYFDGEDTPYLIWDRGSDMDIVERIGRQTYSMIDGSYSHERLADILIRLIKEDLEAGKLGEEA